MSVATAQKPGLVQVILSSWLLLTYDIPAKERKKRYAFLKRARQVGATCYTQSCYMLPNTPEMRMEAEGLAELGEAYVWVSEVEKEAQALKLTQTFHQALVLRLQAVQARVARVQFHLSAGRVFIAYRMATRTVDLLERLEKLAQASQFPQLLEMVEATAQAMKDMLEKKGG